MAGSWRRICADSWASTARRRARVQVDDVSGKRINGLRMPATTGPRMREVVRIGEWPAARITIDLRRMALRARRRAITSVPAAHRIRRTCVGSVEWCGREAGRTVAAVALAKATGTGAAIARWGSRHRSGASKSEAAIAQVQTTCLVDAEARCSRAAAHQAAAKTIVMPVRSDVIVTSLAAVRARSSRRCGRVLPGSVCRRAVRPSPARANH